MFRSPPLLPAPDKIAIWCVKFICNQILEVSGSVIAIATLCKLPGTYFCAAYCRRFLYHLILIF